MSSPPRALLAAGVLLLGASAAAALSQPRAPIPPAPAAREDLPAAATVAVAAVAAPASSHGRAPVPPGSTAVVLNLNARSVTPALVAAAADVVGADHVYATRTREDAVRAARTVVRRAHAAAEPAADGSRGGEAAGTSRVVVFLLP